MSSIALSTTLAGFDDMRTARACIRELRRGQLSRPTMKFTVQSRRKGHEELPLSFTHARGALFQGAAVGGVVGLLAGVFISVLEAQTRGIEPVFIVAFCIAGLIMGGFAGALVGPMNPDPSLDHLEREGELAILVESHDASDIEWAQRVLARWGAHHDERWVNEAPHPPPVSRRPPPVRQPHPSQA